MHYICFNCEENLELPELINSPEEESICFNCQSYLHLEVYAKCTNCNYFYLKNYLVCPGCARVQNEEIKIPPLNYLYVKNEEDYASAISFVQNNNLLALDTEGNGLDPFTLELFLIQIGTDEMVYIFDFRWHKRLASEDFWQSKHKLFILHNAKFDCKVLKHKLGIELSNIYDTFLAERILTCGIERKNSLKDVVEKYLHLSMDKEIREEFIFMNLTNFEQKLTEQLIEYAAKDVQLLPLIYKKQNWELQNNNLVNIASLEFEVSRVIADMELKGIYVDVNAWKRIIEFCEIKKQEIEDKIHNVLIDVGFKGGLFGKLEVNLNSTKELKNIFSLLNIQVEATGDAELAQIDHPFAALLRDYRKYEKQLSSFGESFLALVRNETSRVHPNFQQIGADTGRFSCNNPNLQQIPADEEYRKCFSAPEGKKIIACDYSQQELRLLASLSGDPKFIKFYEDGVDLHTATASMMFNIPMGQVEKDTHRKVAKTINFGLAYGQGAKKLGLTIGVDEAEATKMIEKYFSQFTYIRDWLEGAAKNAQTQGYSKTLMGRKRFYNLPLEGHPEYKQLLSAIGRQGKNTPIQGSGVDMIKLALVKIRQRLKEANLDAYLINVVHDEIIVEAAESDAEEAALIVQKSMVEAGEQLAPNVPILAEVGIGDFWKH